MDLCKECGHDYFLDGIWSGFCHYRKDSDISLGFFRPVCNEGFEPIISQEVREAIVNLSQSLSDAARKTLEEICQNPEQNPRWVNPNHTDKEPEFPNT